MFQDLKVGNTNSISMVKYSMLRSKDLNKKTRWRWKYQTMLHFLCSCSYLFSSRSSYVLSFIDTFSLKTYSLLFWPTPTTHPCPGTSQGEGEGYVACMGAYLKLRRAMCRVPCDDTPMPRHFSRCGAKRAAARLRWQLGQTQSYCFLVDNTQPNTSRPRTFTISTHTQ